MRSDRVSCSRGGHKAGLAAILGVAVGLWACESYALGAEPPITALAFAPDGKSVVAGSQAGLVVLDWPDLKEIQRIETSLVQIHDLAFSPDGGQLAAAGGAPSDQGGVEIFEWPNGSLTYQRMGHRDTAYAVAWQDSERFASAGLDHEVLLWDASRDDPVHRWQGHSRGVTSVCFLPQHNILISAGIDQNLRVWDLESGEVVRTLNNHTDAVHEVVLRPGDMALPMIASISDDRTVRLWQPTISRMVRFINLRATPLGVDWLPDGSRIVVVASDGHVRVINPDTVEVERDLDTVDGWAYSLAIHPSDGSVLVGGREGQLARVVLSAPDAETDP